VAAGIFDLARVRGIYLTLLGRQWVDRDGRTHEIRSNDLLAVSSYNMQVNLLRSVLPDGARVGTVDMVQGQEAAFVLISMTTSSADDMLRNIEFLFKQEPPERGDLAGKAG